MTFDYLKEMQKIMRVCGAFLAIVGLLLSPVTVLADYVPNEELQAFLNAPDTATLASCPLLLSMAHPGDHDRIIAGFLKRREPQSAYLRLARLLSQAGDEQRARFIIAQIRNQNTWERIEEARTEAQRTGCWNFDACMYPRDAELRNEEFRVIGPTMTLLPGENESIQEEQSLLRENARLWIPRNLWMVGDSPPRHRFRRGFLNTVFVHYDRLGGRKLEPEQVREALESVPSINIIQPASTGSGAYNLDQVLALFPRSLPQREYRRLFRFPLSPIGQTIELRFSVEPKISAWGLRRDLEVFVNFRFIGENAETRFRFFFAIFNQSHEVQTVRMTNRHGIVRISRREIPEGGYYALVGLREQ